MSPKDQIEQLAKMTQCIRENPAWLAWVEKLGQQPLPQRRQSVLQFVAEMQAQGEDPQAVATFRLLADPEILRLIGEALQSKAFNFGQTEK